jgi:hypothetical protein
MTTAQQVTVRMIAFLDTYRKERGLSSTESIEVADEGVTAQDLAASLDLPLERIEGVFLNHSVSGLDVLVRPGDRVAFVPYGTPASHPAFFGPFVKR